MKVLSIREPYASLITNNKKYIETRSWKTNYRGEIYIHASISKVSKFINKNSDLMKLIGDDKFNYGYITCKCNLVDCIKMTKEFILDIKNNHYDQYICGEYEVGRYAWILKNIKVLDKFIKAKGKLGIWNYEGK